MIARSRPVWPAISRSSSTGAAPLTSSLGSAGTLLIARAELTGM